MNNQELLKISTDSIKHLSTVMHSAFDFASVNENLIAFNSNVQKMFASALKDYDMSYIRTNMVQIASRLKEIYEIGNLEYTDTVEEHRIDFETDVRRIVDDSNQQNWQQKFSGTFQKWRTKNPIIAFILTAIIFQMILMIIYDVAKYLFIKPSQATIKETPSINAEVVIKIEQHEMVTVIESQPYWVRVVYLNSEDGEVYEGWLPKRACKELEYEDSEENEIDDTQTPELVETEDAENMEDSTND